MIFLDANLFLAYDNINDVHHLRAVKLLTEIESDKYGLYFTSDYVFNEVVGVTFRKLGRERASILGEHILKSILIINIDDNVLLEAWNLFKSSKSELNLVDCTNIVASKLAGAEFIATFDKEFKKSQGLAVVD